ncbi:MAG: hypothetical protein WCB15_11295 [Desulfobacterales bacterium]
MKTFTEPKELVENPHYQDQRQKSLADLSNGMIDVPIIELINDFNKLPFRVDVLTAGESDEKI